MARYGLAYDDLKQINPCLIYCSITGFGQDGPLAKLAGYDLIFQAMGGLMSITGERDDLPGGGPQKLGVAFASYAPASDTGKLQNVYQYAENVNWTKGIDPKTGAIKDPVYPEAGKQKLFCPNPLGGRQWNQGTYDPTAIVKISESTVHRLATLAQYALAAHPVVF
jgi:hypothetical protein